MPWRRLIFLGAAAIGLYLVWPRLVDVFAAAPGLVHISPLWFVAMFLLETLSFASYWGLMRITLHEPRWSVVATTQLASNAFSRLVPGGAVSGGPASYSMLVAAGAPRARTITGLAANTLLSTAVLLALPILSVPAIIVGGLQVSSGLLERAAPRGGDLRPHHRRRCAGPVHQPSADDGRPHRQRVRNHLRRHHPPLSGLPQQLIEERDLIKQRARRQLVEGPRFRRGQLAVRLHGPAGGGPGGQRAVPKASLVLLAYVVAALLGMIPITPGGLGFVEVGLIAALGLAGVPAAGATLATLMYRLRRLLVADPRRRRRAAVRAALRADPRGGRRPAQAARRTVPTQTRSPTAAAEPGGGQPGGGQPGGGSPSGEAAEGEPPEGGTSATSCREPPARRAKRTTTRRRKREERGGACGASPPLCRACSCRSSCRRSCARAATSWAARTGPGRAARACRRSRPCAPDPLRASTASSPGNRAMNSDTRPTAS